MSVVENSVHRSLAVPLEVVPSLVPKILDPYATSVPPPPVEFGVWSCKQVVVSLDVLCGVPGWMFCTTYHGTRETNNSLDLCLGAHSHGPVPSVDTVIHSLISPTIPYTPARKTHIYFLSTVFVVSIGLKQVKLVVNFDHHTVAFHRFLHSLIVKWLSVFLLLLRAAVTPLCSKCFWGFCQLATRGYFAPTYLWGQLLLVYAWSLWNRRYTSFSYSMAFPAFKCVMFYHCT